MNQRKCLLEGVLLAALALLYLFSVFTQIHINRVLRDRIFELEQRCP